MLWASRILAKDKDSLNTFFHLRTQLAPSGYSTSSKANKSGEIKTMANIHVARMKKGHSLDLMSGERSGNTSAPNRSTAIRIRFWIETAKETLSKKGTIHKAWPSWPPIRNELACKSDNLKGIENTRKQQVRWGHVCDKIIYRFSWVRRFTNDDNNERICDQWNDDDQTVGNGSSDFQRRKI